MADMSAYTRAKTVLDEYEKDTSGEVALIWRIQAAITKAEEAERAAILAWAKNYHAQILDNPREGEFMSGLESAANTVVKAIEARALASEPEGE